MTAQADKVVVFRLAVEVDPRAEQEARRFGERLGALDKARHESARSTAERAAREQQRLREREEREKLAAFDREMRAADKLSKAEADFEARADRDRQRRWQAQERAQQQAVRSYEQGQNKMREASYRAMEGITKIGEGLLKIGIVNKETSEDILRAWVSIRGMFDEVRGGIEVWRALTEGVRAYRTMVASLTAVEIGAGAAAAGGAVGTAGKVGLGAMLGWGAKKIGGAALAGVAWAGRGLAVAGPYAAMALAGEEAVQFARGEEGLVSATAGWWRARGEASSLEARTARMLAARDAGLASGAQAASLVGEEFAGRRQIAQYRGQLSLSMVEGSYGPLGALAAAQEARAAAVNQRRQAESGLADIAAWRGGPGFRLEDAEVAYARERELHADALAASEREVAAANQILQIQKQITAEKIGGADAAIAKARQEISVREGSLRAAQSAMLSAEERFGLMDPAKQRRLLGVLQKGREGGSLTNLDVELLREFGTTEAQAMVREEGRTRARRALGTEDEESLRKTLTPWEAHAVEREFREMAKVQATINQQLDVKVELKHDIDRIVGEILTQVKAANERELARIRKETAERIQRLYEEQQRAAVERGSAIPKR